MLTKVPLAGLQLKNMSPTNSLKILKMRRNFELLSGVRLPKLSRSLPNLVFQGSQILLTPEIFRLHKSLDLRLLLRLFHFLLALIFISPFVPPDKSSLPTSALTAISEGTGLIRQSALFSTRQEVVSPTPAPVPRPQSQPPSDLTNVLARLGPDKYSDFDFDHISLDSNFSEYIEGSSQVIVKGRLQANISFWQSIGTSKFILDTLSFDYKIPFSQEPTSVFLNNNRSALGDSDFVESVIQELLRVGSIVSCTCPPDVVNPLSVSVQSSGKKRLILDLRHVNFFVKKSKIKFEDAQCMLNLIIGESPSNLWAYSFDIKSGYHHVEIYSTHQRFLGFSWVFNGVRKYFKLVVLAFGLSTGPYIFTKVMRPLVKHWRTQALRIVVYLDDGLGVCVTKDTCLRQSLLVHSDLISSGFVPNKDKCMWIPSQLLRWLGFHWDFARGLLSIPEDKISVLLSSIREVSSSRVVTARMLAQVTGRIISCMLVFGHICKIMTKALHSVIVARASWNARVFSYC